MKTKRPEEEKRLELYSKQYDKDGSSERMLSYFKPDDIEKLINNIDQSYITIARRVSRAKRPKPPLPPFKNKTNYYKKNGTPRAPRTPVGPPPRTPAPRTPAPRTPARTPVGTPPGTPPRRSGRVRRAPDKLKDYDRS